MSAQPSFDLLGGRALDPREGIAGQPVGKGELTSADTLPRGPFRVGMTHGPDGDELPYTVQCGDGRAVAGHVPSREIARAIADALNRSAADD